MNRSCWSTVALLGRVLLSHIFIMSGIMKVLNWSQTALHMQQEGMIAVPFFLAAAIAVEIGFGSMILCGCGTRVAAWGLFLFLIPVTAIFHDFWKYEGEAQQNQMQHFSKNVTIMGGLLTLAAAGAGGLAMDTCCKKRPDGTSVATS